MAKVTYSKDELANAVNEGEAVVTFAVKAPHLKGFAYKDYSASLTAPPDLAREAVAWFDEWSRRVQEAQAAEIAG